MNAEEKLSNSMYALSFTGLELWFQRVVISGSLSKKKDGILSSGLLDRENVY